MTLKRQLLLVSLLTLVLPWAGYQFIRETETALRAGQQQMLAGTARAIAESLVQYAAEFPAVDKERNAVGNQLYGHSLESRPEVDGYFNDWTIGRDALRIQRGKDGPIGFALGLFQQWVYLYVEVSDRNVVYAAPESMALIDSPISADRVELVNTSPPYRDEVFVFSAEAPGPIITYVRTEYGFVPEPTILAHWQDAPGGYHLEARIPASQLGTHIGLTVQNTDAREAEAVRSTSFLAARPGAFVSASPELTEVAESLLQPGMRLLITDAAGWRIASAGSLGRPARSEFRGGPGWLRVAYDALVEQGEAAALAEPDPGGYESQNYIRQALEGRQSVSWFRSLESGRAVAAAAQPVQLDGVTIGSVVIQQTTDAILSLTNEGLARLLNVTLITTLLVAATLLGYATWLSRRIRHLSVAAESALENDDLRATLPSADSGDEIGDLSRSFANVLRQLGAYNEYLRSLASKLSHELRTPLAIVTSSLENLEHEPLSEASAGYAMRAKEGAERLRRILTAMSEASRVEELMQHVEPEQFDLRQVLDSTVAAYRDAYRERGFELQTNLEEASMHGSPELVIQMLDKLVDNAVDFSEPGSTIVISLDQDAANMQLSVSNPGPPLPEQMRTQLFDSMVSVRKGDDRHLGLGLYIARLIAEGHGGRIDAANTDDGVVFAVMFPNV